MSNYKHGNWYCKPANEAEAREIVERAVASGAELFESVGEGADKYRWNACSGWGVYNGRTFTSYPSSVWNIVGAKKYTIEQVREKFPLPSERVGRAGPHFEHEQKEVVRSDVDVRVGSKPVQWDGKGWPPVGVDVEVFHEGRWIGATTVGEFGYHKKCMVCTPNGGGFYGFYADEIRPIKTEREKFIGDVHDRYDGGAHHSTVTDLAGRIYDAIKSGNLKAPEAE